mmetsp:Transcript_106429/g.338959  ORF Transcript_106429/g.338959 Transcript_106429/m.338959 type:complete len:359 (-) Transcript_106429:8-1084(-)
MLLTKNTYDVAVRTPQKTPSRTMDVHLPDPGTTAKGRPASGIESRASAALRRRTSCSGLARSMSPIRNRFCKSRSAAPATRYTVPTAAALIPSSPTPYRTNASSMATDTTTSPAESSCAWRARLLCRRTVADSASSAARPAAGTSFTEASAAAASGGSDGTIGTTASCSRATAAHGARRWNSEDLPGSWRSRRSAPARPGPRSFPNDQPDSTIAAPRPPESWKPKAQQQACTALQAPVSSLATATCSSEAERPHSRVPAPVSSSEAVTTGLLPTLSARRPQSGSVTVRARKKAATRNPDQKPTAWRSLVAPSSRTAKGARVYMNVMTTQFAAVTKHSRHAGSMARAQMLRRPRFSSTS